MALLTFEYKQSFDSFSFELMLVITVITEKELNLSNLTLDIMVDFKSKFELMLKMASNELNFHLRFVDN
jgi:hypothetical protein